MRKSQILTIDTILAFLIAAILIYITTTTLAGSYSYTNEQLLTIIKDASEALEITGLDINSTLNHLPKSICMSINVKVYDRLLNAINTTSYAMNDCIYLTGTKFVSKRSVLNDKYWNIVTIEGWYR